MTSAFEPSHLQAVVALAGFYVGEAYHVPWAGVPVPDKLQTKLFPFVEKVLANLKAESQVNQRVVNFLELLQQLRPFFWQVGAHCFSCLMQPTFLVSPCSYLLQFMSTSQIAASSTA